MESGNRVIERLRDDLDVALQEAEDESARYHIRRAAQRVEVIREGLPDTTMEMDFSIPDDHQRSEPDT